MSDVFTPQHRSRIMAKVRGKNTRAELLVRSILHRLGYRFRLHVRPLPGTPDIVLPRHRKIIMVHGCFWHGHPGCKRARIPQSRRDYWTAKIAANRRRDAQARAALAALGYKVLVIWTCALSPQSQLEKELRTFMEED